MAAATSTRLLNALHKLGLYSDWDLALHLPLRYEDETRLELLTSAHDGQTLQFEATVLKQELSTPPRRQLRVTVEDDAGTMCVLRFLTFYASQQQAMAVGARLRVRGELRMGLWGREMVHPVCRSPHTPLPKVLTPVYPTSAGLPQAWLRQAIAHALRRVLGDPASATQRLRDTLPTSVWSQKPPQYLMPLPEALLFLHQPEPQQAALTDDHQHPAWQRLKAEELLAQQLSQTLARRERARFEAPALIAAPEQAGLASLDQALLEVLPFALTGAQRRVVADIVQDMARTVPMHRLLQGDVGSGKTVVAALAACVCMQAGWQCALMAPTEILATQHFAKLVTWLTPLLSARGLSVAWLIGSQKKKERTAMLAQVASGEAGLVVGTHALIQEQVRFARLGLVIIDEQHRFGVAQRLALRQKLEGREPHLLMMTATPIPRTLAMSYCADLDVSTIDELPPGRTPIVTKVISQERREEVIARIAAQVAQGRQVYWVCPLIDETPDEDEAQGADAPPASTSTPKKRKKKAADLGESTLSLRNVTDTHAELSAALPGVAVALLHSRLPTADKQAVMARFAQGRTSVLVSTTVIEVGVDVPNASLMVIEHAERFGLSQLHQLRGRVGRGAAASACVLLFTAPLSPHGRERLKAMAQTNDGFEIARIDLALRGPGEFLGARQSGEAMLRFADLEADSDWLEWARAIAPALLDHHPDLAQAHLRRWQGDKADFLKA
ncbi:MAG: ATP-dependent helicase RecG [Pseudomonadota bacterium]